MCPAVKRLAKLTQIGLRRQIERHYIAPAGLAYRRVHSGAYVSKGLAIGRIRTMPVDGIPNWDYRHGEYY